MRKISIVLGLIILLVITSNRLFAQEQLKHKKRFYQAPDGRLYVNKATPIYFFVSDSPNPDGEKHLLTSSKMPQYSNPMYFDTEGWNTLRSPSAVDTATKKVVHPLQDIKFEIFADSKSPVTKIVLGSAPTYFHNNILYAGKGLTVSLNASDATSGVEKTLFSANGANFTEYSKPVSFQMENDYIFKFYSADNVGNAEETKVKKVTLDLTPPITKFTVKGDQFEHIFSPRTKIIFEAQDSKSGVKHMYYAIDDDKPRAISSFINLIHVSEGNHVLKYYSVDNVQNMEEIKTYDFFLDRSAPIVIDEVVGNQFVSNGRAYSSGRTKFKLTAVDNKAGVKSIHYSIDGKAYEVYDKPFYLPTKTGSTSIKYYATDNVNNRISTSNESRKSTATYVDLSGPNLTYSFSSPRFETRDTVFINKDTKITLKAVDTEAGVDKIMYSVDKASAQDFGEPFSVSTEGFHTINYTGFDNVENTNSENFFFIVDNTAPVLYPRFSITPIGTKSYEGKTIEVYPPHVALYLSATDTKVGVSKIYYSLNGSSQRTYLGPITGFSKGKEYRIKVKIIDYLGNEVEEVVNFATGN